ncbi:MAG: hypothetical protein F6K30_18845, partial [Cyanothece sp. SIO2G6]|nr:hypothetical protein [Cyanothece sp. SIO2G6]
EVEATIEFLTDLDRESWVDPPPDVVVLILDPNLSSLGMTALMNELNTLIDAEQTPVILGNNADSIWPWLPHRQEHHGPDGSTIHPLANLYGLTPRVSVPARQQASRYGLTHSDWRSPPSILYAWDGAALMMLAAEATGSNDRQAIESALRTVANPPGIEVTDVCQGLELLRLGEAINYQGLSGAVDIDQWGNVNPASQFELWRIGVAGDRQIIEALEWRSP